jgi:hypothetical protein
LGSVHAPVHSRWDPKLRRKFAAKDAADFVAVAKAQAGGLYEKVIPYPQHENLTDKDATKDATNLPMI